METVLKQSIRKEEQIVLKSCVSRSGVARDAHPTVESKHLRDF